MTKTTSRLLAVFLAGLLATATLCLYTLDAAAYERQRDHQDNDIEIDIDNESHMLNTARVSANTGDNLAVGGRGGDGDDGGSASRGTGGDGGNGGDGYGSGNINTDRADAYGTIVNEVNHTTVVVEVEDPTPAPRMMFFHRNEDTGAIEIEIDNESGMMNLLGVHANTGRNMTVGGTGGDGDDGGDAYSQRSWNRWFMWMNPTTSGGDGGDGGDGGASGNINTAPAYADGYIGNAVNHEVVRVRTNERPTLLN